MTDGLSPEELDKVGSTAGKLVLGRALADVIYSAQARLPTDEVGRKVEKFLDALDRYIDWRMTGSILEVIGRMEEKTRE